MIEVTEKAASELKTLLEQEEKPELALRIFVAGVACSGVQYGLAFDDEVKEDDVTMESNGIKLIMNKDIETSFSEGSIDFVEDENGKGFLIRNPTAGGCGTCGGGCH
ncbi:iron-sulfur cluster assembly accessory protein [Methanosarcina sp. Z-7115]|jgi:iron-sulfur cluster insertion protein|uniref:Iron-sulfur cluster assembly accessory protein n=1 Tax=Methanosarcina baikalica TaxID=3073890 RepID=A0ABU2D093_9EURY|nr:iron-sulfur cluster assembly accessory protein [Methanosarcina sp. Z-7115]MDR7665379.1 iron-sulfur cluster assembly accessory protein [Methanosarcina sp. Z-7115]